MFTLNLKCSATYNNFSFSWISNALHHWLSLFTALIQGIFTSLDGPLEKRGKSFIQNADFHLVKSSVVERVSITKDTNASLVNCVFAAKEN